MHFKIVESPSTELINEITKKIEDFNIERWEIKEKIPLAIVMRGDKQELLAGASGKTFGLWLLIDNIWVSEKLRGNDIGSQLLMELENAATKRGCEYALLDTLNFQARPFYEKFGYTVEWTQQHYPKDGCKYFMVKEIR